MTSTWQKIKYFIQIFRQAYGSYGRAVIVLVVLGFAGGFLEGIGVNALIPLLSFFVGESGVGNDFISQTIEKFFGVLQINFNLISLLVFISLLFILKALITLWFNYVKVKIRSNYELEVRAELFKKTMASNWSSLVKQKIGHLETVLLTEVRVGAELIETISTSVMALTNLLVYLAIAINISVAFTLTTLVVGGAMFFVIKPILFRIRKVNQQATLLNKEVAHFINEQVIGLRAIKVMSGEQTVSRKGHGLFARLRDYQIRSFILRILISALMQPISVIYISVAVGWIHFYGNALAIGALAALVYLIHRIFTYIQSLQSNLAQMNSSLPFLEDVLRYTNQTETDRETDQGQADFYFQKTLEFRDVSFAYGKGKVLDGISFTVQRGEMIGLIGLSGAGKTTVFDLLLRMLKPQKGKIMLDGVDNREIKLREWRRNIGYVSQDLFLLNDTILNNIKFYDETVSDEAVIVAARQAQIHEFISHLPLGYQTTVGERGIRLSVGQRQRITIARVLARKPQLLLLDEATSALDSESEARIQEIIDALKRSITVIVIAHRLSTVKNSDRLLVLDDGKIKEEGSPEALLADAQSYFHRVYNRS